MLEKSRDVAAQEVRDKVDAIARAAPAGTDPPVIDKFDVDAAPVMTVVVSGRRDLREVTEIARRQIKEVIETVRGVGAVILVGGQERAVNISVDTDRLTAQGLSIDDVRRRARPAEPRAARRPASTRRRELVLRTMGRIERRARVQRPDRRHVGGRPIRVRDIGYAEDGVVEPRSLARLNGDNAVS